MLTIIEIQAKLGDRNLSEVARRCGLSYDTVHKVAKEPESNISYRTLEILNNYLAESQSSDAEHGVDIEEYETQGHTSHCARRLVWGDGRCECKLPSKPY